MSSRGWNPRFLHAISLDQFSFISAPRPRPRALWGAASTRRPSGKRPRPAPTASHPGLRAPRLFRFCREGGSRPPAPCDRPRGPPPPPPTPSAAPQPRAPLPSAADGTEVGAGSTAAATARQGSEMSAILRELLCVSEKAANIARACRQQDALFQLLIEEKKDGDKNKKFAVDFKTLADVLVQEVIKQNMENKFPGLGEKVFGEESNEFTNDLGEKIILRLCAKEEETAELLSKVLNGNKLASEALAKVVHQDVTLTDPTLDSVEINIPQDTLGIWVDPIDSTYQYIKGSADIRSNRGIFPSGLQCVTILIGVYDVQTGIPLMGVINQPFFSQDVDTHRWKGQCYWGLSYMGTNIHSLQHLHSAGTASETQSLAAGKSSSEAKILAPCFSAVISTSEKEPIRAALSRICGDSIFRAAGAGYKSLCVVQGLVDIYIFSEDTTFKWDSCAAHAILRAMGGGMVDLKECLQRNPEPGLDPPQLVYHMENEGATGVEKWANKGGLIAYRSRKQLEIFLSLLIQNLTPAGSHI